MFASDHGWSEWNGKFRDTVRNFIKGTYGEYTSQMANCISGHSAVYGYSPTQSINFVTCHDGFSLMDLVSYAGKHNEANGEGNRDGIDNNISWNCGIEGNTTDKGISSFRQRQRCNFMVALLFSR